mmetsp:Transcript_53871/g.175218  ORF Transcript_53871/g.175218 Transcript_53871/m.175218 type:complete len:151 (+) Transcript_53871:2022-2474(+)
MSMETLRAVSGAAQLVLKPLAQVLNEGLMQLVLHQPQPGMAIQAVQFEVTAVHGSKQSPSSKLQEAESHSELQMLLPSRCGVQEALQSMDRAPIMEPTQGISLQDCSLSGAWPRQLMISTAVPTLFTHCTVRVCRPPPHATEHRDQAEVS